MALKISREERKAPVSGERGRVNGKAERGLGTYLLPVLLVGVLGIAGPTLIAWLALQEGLDRLSETRARAGAEVLGVRISAYSQAREAQLEVVARSATVRQALKNSSTERDRASRAMQALLPGVLQVRLFPNRSNETLQPDTSGKAPLGFAGVEMVVQTLKGQVAPAEIHQIASGKPYLALARPVTEGGSVIGAIFGAWPLEGIQRSAKKAMAQGGRQWLTQGGANGYVIAGSGRPPANARKVAVPGTLWEIYYEPVPVRSGATLWLPLAAAGAMVLLLLGVGYLQLGKLRRDLVTDIKQLISLTGGSHERERDVPHISLRTDVVADAATFLVEFLREKRRGGGTEVPGQPPKNQMPASGAETAVEATASLGIDVRESEEKPAVSVPASCFRAYDIRGLAGTELTEEVALGVGWAFGELARDNGVEEVFVAHDSRLSSPTLYEALCNGLSEMGLRVIELGMAPVALLYFAMHRQPESAAVMVTGSHNPPEYNGFKLYLRAAPVHGEQLQQLRERMRQGGFEPRPGSRESIDLLGDYLDAITQDVSLAHPVTVVVDGGNGAAGEVACELLERLGCEVVPLFCEPDGTFPNHHPDPSRPENLEALRSAVVERGAALGIAFDGDGDRIGVVDDRGEVVRPEHLLMLLAGDMLRRHPGSDVVFDVKSSRHLAGFILGQGGRPIMWRAGHTLMKEKMQEIGALLGGEYSGHIYIKERWLGSDDAIYVAARLLEVVTEDPRPLHEQLEELPASPATPEFQLMMAEGQPQQAMQAIMAVANFPDARVVDIDGLRIEFGDSWGLVRPSNTTPSLVFRFEADNETALEQIEARFRELLQKALPDVTPPF